jgi:hypothetical protein
VVPENMVYDTKRGILGQLKIQYFLLFGKYIHLYS